MRETLIGMGIAGAAVGAAALYFWKIRRLPPAEALERAIQMACQIWVASDFATPRSLIDPSANRKLIREAGLILKAELMGRSTYASRLPEVIAKIHPEFAGVDPTDLALGVKEQIIRGSHVEA